MSGHQRKIGEYEIVEVLGRGGMGVVFKARHPRLPRAVALKRVTKPGDKALARFRREGVLLARVRHPNVVAVHEFGSSPEGPFLVIDLVPGQSLQERLAEGAFDPLDAARIISALADAVHALHVLEILHRDLKPDNVILRESDGAPILIDFGLAFAPDQDRLTRTGAVVGTLHYMAPEQMGGESVDARADVYALGGVLFALLSGESPFSDAESVQSLMVAVSHVEPKWRRIRDAPPALQAVVRRCMAKSPEKRYPTAAALHEALEAVLKGDAPSGGPRGGPRWVVAGFLVALIVAVALVLAGDGSVRRHPLPRPSGAETPASPPPVAGAEPAAPQSRRVTAWTELETIRVEGCGSRARGGLAFLDAETLVLGVDGKAMEVWRPAEGTRVGLPTRSLRHLRGFGLRTRPGGGRDAVACLSGGLVVAAVPASEPAPPKWVPVQDELSCLALTPDGRQAVVGTHDGWVKRLDLETGDVLAQVRHETHNRIGAVALAGDLVISCSGRPLQLGGTFTVAVWRGQSLAKGWVQGRIFSSVEALAVDPSGTRVAVGTEAGRVLVGRLEPGGELHAFQGLGLPEPKGFAVLGGHGVPLAHDSGVRRVLWSPDGGLIYSMTVRSPDRAEGSLLRVWDSATEGQVGVQQLDLGVTSAALSANGQRLGIAGWAGGFQVLRPRE